jgi:hypothetical protein
MMMSNTGYHKLLAHITPEEVASIEHACLVDELRYMSGEQFKADFLQGMSGRDKLRWNYTMADDGVVELWETLPF